MESHRSVLASLAVVIALMATAVILTHRQDVAVLDRLAPRIERAQMLAPETTDTILKLVERARAPTGDTRDDLRRNVIIERVIAAIRAHGGRPCDQQQCGESAAVK